MIQINNLQETRRIPRLMSSKGAADFIVWGSKKIIDFHLEVPCRHIRYPAQVGMEFYRVAVPLTEDELSLLKKLHELDLKGGVVQRLNYLEASRKLAEKYILDREFYILL